MAGSESPAAAEMTMLPERLDLARELMRTHVSSGRSPSAAAVVLQHGKLVFAEAFGVQRPNGGDLALDHVWPIASAGKPLTAATVLSLVEEGLIGIMRPIIEYLPELAGSDNDEVLVHHLLTHSAGWESDMFGGRMGERLNSASRPPPDRDFLTHLILSMAMDPRRVAPIGTQMWYGNVNYSLLGEIVRRVTGGTLDAAMRARVFEPLDMNSSALIVDDDLRPLLVQRAPDLPFGSFDAPGRLSFQGEPWEACDAGECGVHMSPLDLARFGQAILNGGSIDGSRFLAPSTVRSMCIDQIPGLPAVFGPDDVMPVASWGYGFGVVCEYRWPYFGGGLVPPGSVTHPGAGGIDYWIDFDHGIVGVFFEVLTEIGVNMEPISGMGNRFQDVITAAVGA